MRYLEKHPKYIAKVTEIAVTNEQLKIELGNLLEGLQHLLDEMNQSIIDLEALRITAEQQLEQAILKILSLKIKARYSHHH